MKNTQPAETAGGRLAPASATWALESNKVFDEEVALMPRFGDPETGVLAMRLTSEPCISHNIYPEAPIATPDGRRFVFARRRALDKLETFWVGDIQTMRVRQVTDEPDAAAPVVAADGSWLFYSAGRKVMRMSPATFEREAVFEIPDGELVWVGGIVSLDYTATRFLAPAKGRAGVYGVAVIDIKAGTARIIYEGPDVHNPLAIFGLHGQYSRNADRKVLIQVNNGMEIDKGGNIVHLIGEKGASLVVVNDDGTNPLVLKAGFSMVERVQGHQCWVGHEDMVLTTLHRRERVGAPWIQDRVVAVVPGHEYRVVGAGRGFTHIGSSPDGRWWVADDNKTGDLYVGSVETARYKLFWRSGATFGSPQYTHPHPFFMGDGKAIGWNSDVTGVPQVYAARIPEGFLDSLR